MNAHLIFSICRGFKPFFQPQNSRLDPGAVFENYARDNKNCISQWHGRNGMHLRRTFFGILALSAILTSPSKAADKVHAAKSIGVAWAFLPFDVGIRAGIFAQYDLEADTIDMAGDAKLQQALTSDAVDFGVGSGPSMAFAIKGSSVIAIAAFASEPRDLAVVVAPDSTIKSVTDLKGKLLAISTPGSLTQWLAARIGVQEGWGSDGVKTVALGTFDAFLAALKTHQIDGMVTATEAGFTLEEKNQAKILIGLEDFAPKFHTHVLFARKDLVSQKPELVQRFVKGFLASIAFMKTNKAATSAIAQDVLHMSPAVADKTYDYEISMLDETGRFDPAAIDVLKQSFVEMGILTDKPSNDKLFTTTFVGGR
jgi:NitT/TauT family transport system substrate-binding protein